MNELSILDSIFNDLIGCAADYSNPLEKSPKVDVKENKDCYTFEMDLPGHSENDVNIELEHNNLTISSVKQDKTSEKPETKENTKWILRERRQYDFSRRFTLPDDADSESITASLKNGLLTVKMQKKISVLPKKILIEKAS